MDRLFNKKLSSSVKEVKAVNALNIHQILLRRWNSLN